MQVLFALLGLLLVIGLYALVMHLAVHSTDFGAATNPSDRDAAYALLHLGILLVATAGGFALGRWLNGMGIAYATLFFLVVACAMVFLQIGTQSLACNGGPNDIISHWTC